MGLRFLGLYRVCCVVPEWVVWSSALWFPHPTWAYVLTDGTHTLFARHRPQSRRVPVRPLIHLQQNINSVIAVILHDSQSSPVLASIWLLCCNITSVSNIQYVHMLFLLSGMTLSFCWMDSRCFWGTTACCYHPHSPIRLEHHYRNTPFHFVECNVIIYPALLFNHGSLQTGAHRTVAWSLFTLWGKTGEWSTVVPWI